MKRRQIRVRNYDGKYYYLTVWYYGYERKGF